MFKILISAILALVITNSCSVKNPFNKKNEYVYLDCPKSLVLLKAKSIELNDTSLSINKDLSLICSEQANKNDLVSIQVNYEVEVTSQKSINDEFTFWLFVTNKQEDQKLYEENFTNLINLEIPEDSSGQIIQNFSFSNSITITKDDYKSGVRVFVGITPKDFKLT